MPIDWETAYDNMRAVPGAKDLAARWQEEAGAFRARLGDRARRIAAGPHPRAVLDLFQPEGRPEGLAVFIHGGYWVRNAPEIFSHLAAGALARGWAVAMPGYPLCPEARIPGITAQVARGIAVAAAEIAGPIRLAGHSAGGHLATRMLCVGVLAPEVLPRIASCLPISGLFDLRPLMRTPMQPVLSLELAEARAESPALLEPIAAVPVTVWVGADELPELRRQSALLANVWTGSGVATRLVEEAGQDHFSVIEALADPDSPITRALVGA